MGVELLLAGRKRSTPPFPGGTSLPLSRPVHEVRFRPRGLAADAVEAAVEEDGGDAETEQEA